MGKYISKDALVAEIKSLMRITFTNFDEGVNAAAKSLLESIDTLETKEVDLEKERMSECPYRQVGCTMYEGIILECNGACGWVVDHLNLKELKTNKGE